MFKIVIEGPDAQDGKREELEFRGQTTACNVYTRLQERNHVTLEFPDGKKIDSDICPDPWEAYPQA